MASLLAVEFDGGHIVQLCSANVQGHSSRRRPVMRESEYTYLRLREARERFKENRYEARRPELWAEVEYWEWRYSRRDR